jgi:dipeptidyl aminopeptidase/acylaminoacyl peptidase
MRRNSFLLALLAAAIAAAAALPGSAQAPRALTAADYARAEKMLAQATAPLVLGASVRPTWLPDGRFWYLNNGAEGSEFVLVDPARRTRAPAFDHARIAAALSAAAGETYRANSLPFTSFEFVAAGGIAFDVGDRRFTCDAAATRCTAGTRTPEPDRNVVVSPDGRLGAFIRAHNLWVRELATGRETQLTRDGTEDFGYATNNAGWTKSDRPVLAWSPDSKKIATFQHDGRNVGEMYLVNTTVGHPTLEAWKYPLPGDEHIFTMQRVVIDVEPARVVRLQMPPDAHRSTVCDHIVCGGQFADLEWYPDGSQLAFVSSTRDHKQAKLRVADAQTGAVRDVLEETVATQFESGARTWNWRVLPASGEVIWYSERDDWGHLYLYDLATGRLKHQITTGPGPVLDLVRLDEKSRTLWFIAGGREPGRDPYFRHLYRIGMDGKNLRLLTPEDAHHEVTLSTAGRFFVDSYSKPDAPPITVIRDLTGRQVQELEKSDISRLVASGWTPPIPFTVKARDGSTDLHGLLYRPTAFDSTRRYPIINYIYPGPQTGSVGGRAFSAARGDKRALAELGFIVVEVDAMGTPGRSKSFHDAYYGDMGDNGLPDQIAMMRQLAARHPWIDLDRAGIYGHSGGGFASTDAILRYPDFFKVAVSQAGNHDNRNYEDDWGERYQGLLVRDGADDNYAAEANQTHTANLRGKLLLAHGGMDANVPPYNTYLVVDALQRANKDYDLILFPNAGHGFGALNQYMMRRRWDYFVRHLLDAEPPKEYEIGRRATP